MKQEFDKHGYHIERAIFSTAQCRQILDGIYAENHHSPLIWHKGAAASIPSWTTLVRHDPIVDRVCEFIGNNVLLWGASLIIRDPSQIHLWHNDLESVGSPGFVSVWIGLKDTNKDTSLKVIPGSHLAPKLLVQYAEDRGIHKEEMDDDRVLEWSQSYREDSYIDYLNTTDGDALFFDGRLWHGSNNTSFHKRRVAVLLQYARTDLSVRIPQHGHQRWPMVYATNPKPPCLLVRGTVEGNLNSIVPGPAIQPMKSQNKISTLIEPINVTDEEVHGEIKKSFPLLEGPSPELSYMECHYSSLTPGSSPHPPHIHKAEEILIVVKGRAELIVEDAQGSNQLNRHVVEPGDFIYYPIDWRHTLENTSDEPVVYLMWKWKSDEYHSEEILKRTLVKGSQSIYSDPGRQADMSTRVLLEGKTVYLRKLHAHHTHLDPGKGYEAHADAYDVSIVLFEGEVETLGERVQAPSSIYYAAGEMHGMKNIGTTTAKYIVFEFHGKHGELYEHPRLRRRRKLKASLTHPGILVDYLKRRFRRFLKK